MRASSPAFPLRIIFDDGEVRTLETPEELMSEVDSIDSTDPAQRVWIRDDLDRTILLKMSGGEVRVLSVKPEV
jgi:hypothetical protein